MLTYFKRAHLTTHPVGQQLFKIMDEKKSNLCVALDVTSQQRLLALADLIGPEICLLKTHVDILDDYTSSFGKELAAIAHRHNFLIFEDRKFADIGQTVSLQYERGIYRICEWADLINAHILPGPGIIEGLASVGLSRKRGLLLLAQMSSAGNFATKQYAEEAVKLAERYSNFVCGFISMGKVSDNPGMIHMTPGVKLHAGQDALGQRYRTVEEVLLKELSDIIIVGRDITYAADPLGAAKQYRERAWECYANKPHP